MAGALGQSSSQRRGAGQGGPRSPLAVARAALDAAAPLGVALEAYVEFGRRLTVKAYAGDVESVSSSEPRGLGVRALVWQRNGYAYSADLSPTGIADVVRQAVENARASDPDRFFGLVDPPARYPALKGLWRPGLAATSLTDKIALVLAAERVALAAPEIETVEEVTYAEDAQQVAVASTTGIEAETEETSCYLFLSAHARRGDEVETGLGFCVGREPAELDAEAAGREAAVKAAALLGAEPCPSGSRTVVFDRSVAAALLGTIGQVLSAEAVQKGRSVFAGKLGQQVGSARVTLVDDGLVVEGLGTSPFDGEGVPQQLTPLIEAGVLKAYLHNSYTARKQGGGAVSTGSARRGSYRSAPGAGTSNLVLSAGDGSLEDLFRRVGDGLYVETASGLHSGINPASGEMSVGVTGHLISGGGLSQPVRETTIASDFLSFLGDISEVAADSRWIPLYGSVRTPSFAVSGIAVSGL
jgi:PmbA protein